MEGLKAAYGAPGQDKIVIEGDYVWLYGVAANVKLPPGQSTIFGLALEAVSNGMSSPANSSSTSRVHVPTSDLNFAEFALLREAGGSFTPSDCAEKPIGPPPSLAIYSTFCRHSRSDDARQTGKANGPKTKGGELQIQQAASTAAILLRLLPYIIAIFGPAFLEQALCKQDCVAVTVGAILLDAMVATVGGWGNQPHLDSQDAGNVAFIGQIAVGDTGDVRGGYFVLPGLGIKIAPREWTLHAVRTTMLQHFMYDYENIDRWATNKYI